MTCETLSATASYIASVMHGVVNTAPLGHSIKACGVFVSGIGGGVGVGVGAGVGVDNGVGDTVVGGAGASVGKGVGGSIGSSVGDGVTAGGCGEGH
jgi:hypothetical protein